MFPSLPYPSLPFPAPPLPDFRKVVEEYTADEELFFKDFSCAFAKLLSLGTPCKKSGGGDVVGIVKSFLGLFGF